MVASWENWKNRSEIKAFNIQLITASEVTIWLHRKCTQVKNSIKQACHACV